MPQHANPLFLPLLITLLLLPTSSISITFHTCNSTLTQIYPTSKSYNPDSC